MTCRNCAGEQWVCENHQDAPWNEAVEHGCECGAGAPCPVCNRDMVCAPYVPWWQSMGSAPKDGTNILVCGGTFAHPDSMGGPEPFNGVSIARWNDLWRQWEGESVSHDDCYSHEPEWWMPLPAIAMDARQRQSKGRTHNTGDEQ